MEHILEAWKIVVGLLEKRNEYKQHENNISEILNHEYK